MSEALATVALAIIAKDEKKQLKRIVKDYEKFFDKIVIAYDDDVAKFETLDKVEWYKYEWCDDFAHKRNFLADKIDTDYYFRLDTDDAILNPERVREVAQTAKDANMSIVYCYYIYSKDEWGNCNAAHYRETLVKKTDNLFWNKPIHENILPKSKLDFNIAQDDSIKIDHLIDDKHAFGSAERNIKYLVEEYNRDKENTDLRTIAYLGRMFFTVKAFDQALYFLQKHVSASGWDEDRYTSWCYLSEIFRQQGKYDDAISCCFEAFTEKPEFPDAYFKLHDVYQEQEEWLKAIHWGELGLKQEPPKTFMLSDPSSYTWRPALSLAFCYFQTGRFEKAYQFFEIAKKAAPTLDFIVHNEKLFKTGMEHDQFLKHFMWLYSYIKEHDEERMLDLVQAIPKELQENEALTKLRNIYLPPKKWEKGSVVIFCSTTPDPWGPPSTMTGVGGSEEATIHMAKELTKLGKKVTVFNNCGEMEGSYDGVEYINWYKFNWKDEFDIIISWRMNIFAMFEAKAKQKLVWLHDLPRYEHLKRVDSYDKLIVLSKYHKSLLPEEVQKSGKVYISTNGINPEDFRGLEKIIRNPKRIIYASSYDRGLELILTNWKEIKKEVPEAEIHIFYGWNIFDKYVKEGYCDQAVKDKLLELMAQDGVHEHGRIGHRQLLKEYAKSGVYAYPTNFAGEINCIALTKALACKCRVVTNDQCVLPERNPELIKSNEDFKDGVIELLKVNNDKPGIDEKYIEGNSWASVAKDWKENIFYGMEEEKRV